MDYLSDDRGESLHEDKLLPGINLALEQKTTQQHADIPSALRYSLSVRSQE